ncbi:hypothetical protein BH09BAC3_BH09BAC3_26020 [soil metagenome]
MLILTTATLLTNCNSKDNCESETTNWKNDAQSILTEFKTVDNEIKSHYDIFKKEEFANSKLFLRTDDSVKFKDKYGKELPKLKSWFKTKDGFISYDKEIITIGYKECNSGKLNYQAWLYKSPTGIRPTFTEKLIAEIKDSVSLGDNWYYILTKCNGCGE